MILPADVTRKAQLVAPYVSGVGERVRDIVYGYCDAHGFAYLGRAKEVGSLAEKIETGRFRNWDDLEDLYACAVVIPTISDETAVLKHLREEFDQIASKERGSTLKDPAIFRFDATRFIGTLKRSSVPGGAEALLNVKFEVQVRTAFEHAWSVTTHALAYKSKLVDWRHLRLAAQLKAAVEQLDQVVSGYEQSAGFIQAHRWPEVDARRLIQEFFESEVAQGRIAIEMAPASWGRFSENVFRVLAGMQDFDRRSPSVAVERAKAALKTEIEEATQTSFPRSISLLQFCIGAITKQGLLVGPVRGYIPLITQELVDLYPTSKSLGKGFDFQFI